jgi:signal transduction histidine kinase
VEWANGAARQVLALSFGPAGEAAPFPEALPTRILDQAQGGSRVEVSGRPFVATWWTTERGRRCVGMVPIPAAGAGVVPENLRTLAEIGRMTATFAHELRNPLASLAGALDLLDGDLHRDERREVATLARNRLQEMRRLLDDTLRLSRPLRGVPEPLDPRAIVETAAAEARLDPKFRGIAVRTEVPGFPVRALGHEQALQQALANLLLNAAEAQEGRGTILVRLVVEGSWIVMRVQDEGPGIPAARREEVFGPFRTTKTGGTGLGLAYVRQVAEAAGGRALIEASDRGACVRVDLPRAL